MTAVNENYELVGKPKTESGLRVPDLEFKASAIVGVKASLDLNKTWEALGRLLLDK